MNFLLQPRYTYGLSFQSVIVLSALVMAIVWSGWALAAIRYGNRILTGLPAFGCFMVVMATLTSSFTMVPGLWIVFYQGNAMELSKSGSHPSVFVLWVVLSFFVGAMLFPGLALLHCLCNFLESATAENPIEKPWRYWRGHFHSLRLLAFLAYWWGFWEFWISVFVAAFLFNGEYHWLPPYTLLIIFGLLTGGGKWLWHTTLGPSPTDDFYHWYRERVSDIKSVLQTSPWISERKALLASWHENVAKRSEWSWVSPRHIVHLIANKYVPSMLGVRDKFIALTGMTMPAVAGCQSSLAEEAQVNVLVFAVKALVYSIPLLLAWFSQRWIGRTLVLTAPYDYMFANGKEAWISFGVGGQKVTNLTLPMNISDDGKQYFPLVGSSRESSSGAISSGKKAWQ